jgi:hypothetical protein
MEYAFRNAIRHEGLRRLADLRHEIKDAFVNLEVLLLRPVCQKCETTVWSVQDEHALYSPQVAQICSSRRAISCIYDLANHHVTFSIDDKELGPYQLVCGRCGRALDIRHKSEIPAEPAYFGEHFQVAENSPADPPTSFKEFLKSTYGHKCTGCRIEFQEDDLTMDQVVARAHGGNDSPLNLQVVCKFCRERKIYRPVRTVELYLDFLLIPEPEATPDAAFDDLNLTQRPAKVE